MPATIMKPPAQVPLGYLPRSVFLAGTIDQGNSSDWQLLATEALKPHAALICNPRREDWNSSIDQDATHPLLREQITWELDALERCTLILMWFEPKSRSPITLLEAGLHARSGKLIIGCPKTFWRAANVWITAERYGVPVVETLDELLQLAQTQLTRDIGPVYP